MVRRLAVAVIGACFFGMVGMSQANALMCGADTCDDAGPTTFSPYSIGDVGLFSAAAGEFSAGPLGPSTDFFHAWTFELNDYSSIAGTLLNINAIPNLAIIDLTLELFTFANTQVPGIFTAPNNSANVTNVAFAFGGLAAGNYFFKVSGTTGPNSLDGQYSANFNVSEVPLPGAVWLFISAILGLVSFSRIRRDKQSV